MIAKRIIFSLLFSNGTFCLSRNFRLQKVGDFEWLEKNYSFIRNSSSIDELIILNVSRNYSKKDKLDFLKNVEKIKKKLFLPITLGGKIRKFFDGKNYFDSGADKVLVNSLFFDDKKVIEKIAGLYGKQAVSLMVDYKRYEKNIYAFKNNGNDKSDVIDDIFLKKLNQSCTGEIIFNSIDRDGTGTGLDLKFSNKIGNKIKKPILLMGGAGKPEHIYRCLKLKVISGVITANLFNFLGNGLEYTRLKATENGILLPHFQDMEKI